MQAHATAAAVVEIYTITALLQATRLPSAHVLLTRTWMITLVQRCVVRTPAAAMAMTAASACACTLTHHHATLLCLSVFAARMKGNLYLGNLKVASVIFAVTLLAVSPLSVALGPWHWLVGGVW